MRKIDIKYLKEIKQVCQWKGSLYKRKRYFKKLLLKFLTVLVSGSSKEMVKIQSAVSSHFYSHWGLVVEALKSYSNFPVFYKEVCFFILDSYTKEKEEKSGGGGWWWITFFIDFVTAQDPHPPPLLRVKLDQHYRMFYLDKSWYLILAWNKSLCIKVQVSLNLDGD